MISSTTIIEFPAPSSFYLFMLLFATSFFHAFGAGYFVIFFFLVLSFSGFHTFSLGFFFVPCSWVEYIYIYVHVDISHLPFFPPSGI